ncbi:uncharacterized protein B0H18DRAFT_1129210 [Fomitopsis serialis]|uniref:uncharacterized protein n=1 Tax=Fomitopsis serialis TaxID=139415 RepID=UPI0020082D8F|nr:uncharacterized protein B0H18DRAFT_1129210 [Neoantrodia serialis]KAH9910981.1 hypothetical protein B0H18DRAFT_1129210 [Neoantrodia serialis]
MQTFISSKPKSVPFKNLTHVLATPDVDTGSNADALDGVQHYEDNGGQHYKDNGGQNYEDDGVEHYEDNGNNSDENLNQGYEEMLNHRDLETPHVRMLKKAVGMTQMQQMTVLVVDCPKPIHMPSRHGPRAKDYNEDVQDILDVANSLFRCRITTINAFPSNSVQDNEPGHDKDSQLRGELKNKVKPLVKCLYGFGDGSAKRDMRKNREKASALTHESAFAYKDPALNQPEGTYTERKGIYRHPIIQKAINATWFANRADEGVVFEQYFEPVISLPTIALILMAVHCCIDKWGTGKQTPVNFTENDYKAVHLPDPLEESSCFR